MKAVVYTLQGSLDVLQFKELEITPLGGHITGNSGFVWSFCQDIKARLRDK